MQENTLPRIAANRCKEIVDRFHIELEEGAALIDEDTTPQDFLRLSIEQEQWMDAVRFLAHALPKREAVGWACLCVRTTLDDETPSETAQALKATEAWVKNPTEETRRAAQAAAEATQMDHPASFAAMAAFTSGGSIAPPDNDEVPPDESLAGRMVANAVILAAYTPGPESLTNRFRTFLARGIEVAKTSPPKPS